MRICRLVLDGFGCFVEPREFSLAQEPVTVVFGANEAGKSTLMAAVRGTLFGFRDPDEERAYHPDFGDGKAYRATLEFELNRVHHEITRDFLTHEVLWRERSDGADWEATEYAANPRGVDQTYFQHLASLLAIPTSEVFQATTYVSQLGLETDLSEELLHLMSGSLEANYQKVLSDLEREYDRLSSVVPEGWPGGRRRTPREIDRVQAEMEALRTQLNSADNSFRQTARLSDEAASLEGRLTQLRAVLASTQSLRRALDQLVALRSQASDLEKQSDALTDELKTVESALAEEARLVGRLETEFADLKDQPADLDARLRELQVKRAEAGRLESELEETRNRLKVLNAKFEALSHREAAEFAEFLSVPSDFPAQLQRYHVLLAEREVKQNRLSELEGQRADLESQQQARFAHWMTAPSDSDNLLTELARGRDELARFREQAEATGRRRAELTTQLQEAKRRLEEEFADISHLDNSFPSNWALYEEVCQRLAQEEAAFARAAKELEVRRDEFDREHAEYMKKPLSYGDELLAFEQRRAVARERLAQLEKEAERVATVEAGLANVEERIASLGVDESLLVHLEELGEARERQTGVAEQLGVQEAALAALPRPMPATVALALTVAIQALLAAIGFKWFGWIAVVAVLLGVAPLFWVLTQDRAIRQRCRFAATIETLRAEAANLAARVRELEPLVGERAGMQKEQIADLGAAYADAARQRIELRARLSDSRSAQELRSEAAVFRAELEASAVALGLVDADADIAALRAEFQRFLTGKSMLQEATNRLGRAAIEAALRRKAELAKTVAPLENDDPQAARARFSALQEARQAITDLGRTLASLPSPEDQAAAVRNTATMVESLEQRLGDWSRDRTVEELQAERQELLRLQQQAASLHVQTEEFLARREDGATWFDRVDSELALLRQRLGKSAESADPEEALAKFREFEALRQTMADNRMLRAEVERGLEAETALAPVREAIAPLEAQIGTALLASPIPRLLDRLEQLRQLRAELARAQTRVATLRRKDAVERERADVERELRLRRTNLEELLTANPALRFDPSDLQSVHSLAQELETEINRASADIEGAEAARREVDVELRALERAGLIDVESVQETLHESERRLAQLQLQAEALRLGHDLLAESVAEYLGTYRDRIEEDWSRQFVALTAGRYAGLRLRETDKGLAPEILLRDARTIPPGLLSVGASDQLYLALRAAMSQRLSAGATLPFLLDDPFVNFSDDRLVLARELVRRLAERHQILLFTCHPAFLDWGGAVVDLR